MVLDSLPTLSRLLGSITPDEFRTEYYGRRVLLTRGDASWIYQIFSWDDVNRLLNTSVVPHSTMRLSLKAHQPFTPTDAQGVIDACREGASLVINTIHLFDPKIGQFSRSLEDELGEPINVNMYLASAGNPAFACHYDCHDVILLQLEGKKRWRVFAPTIESPLFDMKGHGGRSPEAPILETTLSLGDVLYVPRGFWHEVVAEEGLSLHLTVGIDAYTGIDLLNWVADELRANLQFRQTMPLVYKYERDQGFPGRAEHIAQLRNVLNSTLMDPELIDRYYRHFVATRKSVAPFRFPDLLDDRPASSRQLQWYSRPDYQQVIIDEKGADATVTCWGRVVTFPAAATSLLRELFSRTLVSMAELRSFAPHLPAEAIWAVVDSLCREGILNPAGSAILHTTSKDDAAETRANSALQATAGRSLARG